MNKPLIFGYLQSWSSPGVSFSEAASKGYNAILLAFGAINNADVSIFNNVFPPAPTPEALRQDIAKAKTLGAEQILLSFGGGNNTYEPNGAPIEELARNIVGFLNEFGFTGVDFDLEIDTNAAYLSALCHAIKQLDSSILITAAPQMNQGAHDSELLLVSTGSVQLYKPAIEQGCFDYLLVQNYNNPWPRLNSLGQTDVEFMSEAFFNLKLSVPPETKLVIGEPANKQAAGTSIFTASQVPNNIYQQMSEQYQSMSRDPQYGGAMVWSINLDAETNYQFISAVKAIG